MLAAISTRRLLSAAIAISLSSGAFAQSDSSSATTPQATNPQSAAKLQTVIVTGTRSDSRTESSSLAPIDVLPVAALQSTGTTDLAEALSRLIPSINFPRPSATDGTDAQRPAQLRGLSPDQVLVLVNGKRWHTSSIVNVNGTQGRGSAPVDLNTIPLAAIDHIEVLRDGASAQYGSDAIAGVINIILKGGAAGGSVEASGGQFNKGDGRQWQGAANFGIPLNDKAGWIRFTVQDGNSDFTNRAGYTALYPGQRYGDPSVQNKNLLINAQYTIAPNVEFYAFGDYSKRDSTSNELFRTASTAPTLYPNGFQPLLNVQAIDQSLVAGVRGKTDGGWRWDISGNYGGNRDSFHTLDTVNLAWLKDFGSSPSSFYDGQLASAQQAFNVDIAKDISVGWLPNPVTVAFGGQYLRQTYSIEAGDLDSYYASPSASGGAQGFGGWQPNSAGSSSRQSVAEYISLETNLTDKLGVSLAARHEHYSDFGNTTSGALSARYDFTDKVALRGTVSNGFRAPSLAQQDYSATSTTYQGTNGTLPAGLYQTGILPVNNQVAQLLGAEALKPERSQNISLGLVLNPTDNLNISIDAYQIKINNRIILSNTLNWSGSPATIAYLESNTGAINYTSAQYFTNAVNTRTQGLDLVASHSYQFGNGSTLRTTFGYNYNRSQVTDVKANPAQLDALGLQLQRVSRRDIRGILANSSPRSKINLGLDYQVSRWDFNANLTRYGGVTGYNTSSYLLDEVVAPRWLLDVAVNYNVDNWTFTLGSDNVTNQYPTKTANASNSRNGSLPYSNFSPFGFNGAYYYTKVVYHW
jgi:iron complex outermembrane receptor protein